MPVAPPRVVVRQTGLGRMRFRDPGRMRPGFTCAIPYDYLPHDAGTPAMLAVALGPSRLPRHRLSG